jgi:NitT/TauT family transport system substrate-binding protein
MGEDEMASQGRMGWKFAVAGAAALFAPSIAAAQTKIDVALNFLVAGDNVAMFVALEKGWYKQRGLDVDIRTSRGSAEAVKLVGLGAVQLGVSDASTVALAVANEKVPVKAVAVTLYDVPNSIISFADNPVRKPKDLEGKKLAIAAADASAMTLQALYKINNVDPAKVTPVTYNFGAMVPSFLTGKVDATIGFIYGEYLLAKQEAGAREVIALRYADFGIRSYSLCLIANNDVIASKPDAVKAFVGETMRGIQYAQNNVDEAVALLAKHTDRAPALLKAQVEAVMPLMITAEAKANGQGVMDGKRWEATQRINVDFGTQKADVPLAELFTNQFVK